MKYPVLKLRHRLLGCCDGCKRRMPAERLNSVPYTKRLICDICVEERDETAIARPAVLPAPDVSS